MGKDSSAPDMQAALAHHRGGRLRQAEAAYRRILQGHPEHADALHLLGVVADQTGRHRLAVMLIEKAIGLAPGSAPFHNNCGLAYGALGDADKATQHLQRALELRPEFPDALNNLGIALKDRGRLDEAAQHLARAIALKPDYAEAYNSLGAVLRLQDRSAEAVPLFEQALALNPGYAEACNNLGISLHEAGRLSEAIARLESAVVLKPDYAEARNNLGNLLLEGQRPADAAVQFDRAIAIDPKYVEAHNNLGNALLAQGRLDQAMASYEQALALRPDYVESHVNAGIALKTMGLLDEAAERFGQALACDPACVEAWHQLALLLEPGAFSEHAAAIEKLLRKKDIADEDAMRLHFALGKHYDDTGDHAKAFGHYRRANALKRETCSFDPRSHDAWVGRIIAACPRDALSKTPAVGSASELPVFVVGMPRSGTTLVEQILSSHPRVFGAGELEFFNQAARGLPGGYPGGLAGLDAGTRRKLAGDYLAMLEELAPGAARVVDKMPSNSFNLGLIARVFPNACVIHCRRDPLDTCLSIYFQYFARGNSFAYDLEELGRYFSQHQRLMAHWQSALPLRMLEVRYEELVADQAGISREMIGFLGLDWDDACLDFHRSGRAVRTASNLQVRRPMYSRSVGRWQPYAEYLAPLTEFLPGR